MGYLIYGDLGKQPNIISNPFGTAINHFAYYFFVSALGLFIHIKSDYFNKLIFFLFSLSIILEFLQLVVPNRSFQPSDIVGNFVGVLVAYFLVKIYLIWKK